MTASRTATMALFSLGLLGALWSSSAAMVAMIDAMNRAYDIDESRPWWKVRITAILLTVGLAVFVLSRCADRGRPADRGPSPAGSAFGRLHADLEGPAMADRVRADHHRHRARLLLRARCRAGLHLDYARLADRGPLWVIASLAFRFYVVSFGNYEATYGTLTASSC